MLIKTTWLHLRHILSKFKLTGLRVAFFDKSDLQFVVFFPVDKTVQLPWQKVVLSFKTGVLYSHVADKWYVYIGNWWQNDSKGDAVRWIYCFLRKFSFYYVCQFILCIFVYSKMFTNQLFIYNYKTLGMLNAHLKFSRTLYIYKKMAQFSHDWDAWYNCYYSIMIIPISN